MNTGMSWDGVEDFTAPWNVRLMGGLSGSAIDAAFDDWLTLLSGALPSDVTCAGQSEKYRNAMAYSMAPRSMRFG